MIRLIRGFKDILPGEVEVWQQVERTARSLFENFGFREIRIPIMEHTELFARSIGEETDIVEKEMYTFPDRNGQMLTLRPEATASVARAYVEHRFYASEPMQKLYTIGPMFRRERPQKGRYRQFYQINAEVFGIAQPMIDAQIILMLMNLMVRLGLSDVSIHVNSLGCPQCRPVFTSSLSRFLAGTEDSLCANCLRRRDTNPLRVLDCKVPECRQAMETAPSTLHSLCGECRLHFEWVVGALDQFRVSYTVDPRLVRGLDYYTRTTFEVLTGSLGAQNAIAGGGRYDGLVKALGGPDTPGIGFAVGLDRLVEIVDSIAAMDVQPSCVFLAVLGDEARDRAFRWLCEFNLKGIRAEMEFGARSLKSQMRHAHRIGARCVVILGSDELEKGTATVRDMLTKHQEEVPLESVGEYVCRAVSHGLEAQRAQEHASGESRTRC
ncbi:histidine--tRNA ligase [Thermodesulfobacteriota bacterium]